MRLTLWKFLMGHQVVFTVLLSWGFGAYASTMIAPSPTSSTPKRWWYALVQRAAANLDKLKAK